ncbi:aminotransferase class I/II-fold pyridoxal phosphate-dependent enzyme [Rummeliibacillus sp. TYF005]|uniref:aminotransferase class I/II-fold pyridoxal phosphate-dependent enzyme n=1 Tax=Rummeliibacillus sp. TYF005 TaxID=2058214 RepID=UPI000F540767|nr:aminotransferase class I/II-fold pyridoxal phosphate-dependent enzyme [Rummeliibacillus sp. TYF005]RPJ97159.1 aminotransferase class I/II-fold pyridoxal phosphate-dependent enzyme [Rummeliibacillus sp. TYF005]
MNSIQEQLRMSELPKDQEKMPLFDALVHYANRNTIPFDVPGHKMGAQASPLKNILGEMTMKMDVNSMKELDLLSHPQSVIKEAQQLAADAFGADHAYFLVNGTTSGILAMILATCKPDDVLIVPRNCHKSVMNGLILSGAKPVFIEPEVDVHFGISHGISVKNVIKTLSAYPEAKAILVTYPTYFGSMNELRTICKLAHDRNIAVIVDSAHGAHLPFMPELIDPITAGADIVTMSMHKTGGSLTQSSILLLNEGRISAKTMQKTLNMIQTTSANYLLMSSLDVARHELALYGYERYQALKPLVEKTIYEIEEHTCFEVLKKDFVRKHNMQSYDWTKLVIRVNDSGLTGFEVYTLLKEKYKIQMELAEGYVVMAVITTADDENSLKKLVWALREIERLYNRKTPIYSTSVTPTHANILLLSPREAHYAEHELMPIDRALGKISADLLMIYPPGIPLVIPGELISEDVIQQYHYYSQTFGNVLTESALEHHITVVKE